MYSRRGLGAPCSAIVTPPGWVGPIDCTPDDTGEAFYPASQSQVGGLQLQLQQLAQQQQQPQPNGLQSATAWLLQNAIGVMGGLAAAVLLKSLIKR